MSENMSVPLPPFEYMRLVCGDRPDLETHFTDMATGCVRWFKELGLLGPSVTFLDVGCGCGRMARGLLEEPLKAYIGFDRHPGMIEWCQREIASQAPHFQFHYFEIGSAYRELDGHRGSIEASRFHFPFPADTFDTCLASSVFTHMPMDEVAHYLEELHTVTRPGGRVFCSVFCAAETPAEQGANFSLDRTEFLRAVERHGFAWELKGAFKTDFAQNWYLLTKA
jgi:SAM-dependent methyltransferase